MSTSFSILITGQNDQDIHALASRLKNLHEVQVKARLMGVDDCDPTGGDGQSTDLLIHHLGRSPEREIKSLLDMPSKIKPEIVLVGSEMGDTATVMRQAIKAGVRDFISRPVDVDELARTVETIVRERRSGDDNGNLITAFLSPKGGAGASSLAGGVAHVIAERLSEPTLLLDLDIQFGSQYSNMDLHPDKGLKEALEDLENLDAGALMAYISKHPSGLHVLGVLPQQLLLPGEISDKKLNQLLNLLNRVYSNIIVDLPCIVDPIFGLIAENMKKLVIVVQQDFQNLRSGQKLIHILADELQVPKDRLGVIVNRYDPAGSITLQDVERSMTLKSIGTIPSDFKSVNGAANLGVPIASSFKNSVVVPGIQKLACWVIDEAMPVEKDESFLSKLFKK